MAHQISVLGELERIKWSPILPSSGDEIKTRCPMGALHASGVDTDPSCSINIDTLLWTCYACQSSGDFFSFLQAAMNTSRAAVFLELSKRYDLEEKKEIAVSVIEDYHKALPSQQHLLRELYLRGITDGDIRKYRIGFSRDRITIPIKNDGGVYVNIRYYLPGAPKGVVKFKNATGRGSPARVFPIEQLTDYQDVCLCGGEVKAILAARLLNPHGMGATSFTAGEGRWDNALLQRLAGKRVWVMMDVDEAGKRAAAKLAAILRPMCKQVFIVELPLDRDKYPKGDVNDFVAVENGDLWKVIQETKEWIPPTATSEVDDSEEPVESRFSETIMSKNVGRRMKFDAVVAASTDKPFVVPKRVLVDCDKSEECCTQCAVFPRQDKVFHVRAESPAILEMIDVPKEKMDSSLRSAFSIPKKCSVVKFSVEDHFNAWDVRINPDLAITNRDSDRTMQHAICVECDADLNETYKFVGRMYPHPKTQAATLLLAKSEATHDALSRYVPSNLDRLRVFRPVTWTRESIQERLDDIHEDMEVNVTKIFLRRDIQLMYDLAYHSPLVIDVDGKTTKGWVEVLVIGDTSNGKSETLEKLITHYQLGEIAPCKSASVAGLLGGLKQIGSQWYVQWGIIPQHDRRLVALEELSGASVETIGALTDMRSRGVAQTTKIEKRRAQARTRLIGVSNPRGKRKMASYAFGVEAIRDLIGAPEDIRRFDAALVVADQEIDARVLSEAVRNPPAKMHRYTSEICKELILWSWTRLEKDVVFPKETSDAIASEASLLTDVFSDEIPLVDRGSMRHKLSRLSASLACRLFSTGETELQCLVRPCCVEYVAQFLTRIYSSRVFGYKYFSEATRMTTKMIDAASIKVAMSGMAHPEEVRDQMLYGDTLDLQDLQDWTGMDKDSAQNLLSLLVRKRAIRRMDRKYVKTPEFIDFLKSLLFVDVPDHAKEKF